jgi:hypothetical protein
MSGPAPCIGCRGAPRLLSGLREFLSRSAAACSTCPGSESAFILSKNGLCVLWITIHKKFVFLRKFLPSFAPCPLSRPLAPCSESGRAPASVGVASI